MPEESRQFDVDGYVRVAERISLFYSRFPTGRILTRLVERTPKTITVHASVYRSTAETRPSATGWAQERFGDGDINTVACLENAETSAIGRALANLGFSARRPAPTPDRSVREQPTAPTNDSGRSLESLGVRTIFGAPPVERIPRVSVVARDFIALIEDARREGMRSARADAWKARIVTGRCDDTTLERLEPELRRWVRCARDGRSPT